MQEMNLRKCKTCNQLKQRILVGNFNPLNKKYEDEHGSLWNGSTCPSCHKEKAKENMRKLRQKGITNE